MKLTILRLAFVAAFLLVAAPLRADAPKVAKVYRIGFLSPQPQTYQESFRQGLRELGYVDGRNVQIEYRFADGDDQRLPELASQLASLAVDVIVATNSPATRAAMQATRVIPIVMVTSGDPVGSGFIVSFSRPGGNVTGLSSTALDTFDKQVELLKEAFPKVSRAAMLWNPANPVNVAFLSKAPHVSQMVGLALEPVEVRVPGDLKPALDSVAQKQVGGLIVLTDQITNAGRAKIVDFARTNKLPAVYALRQFVDDGGLMSYGVSFADLYRRSSGYVDKILKGAKPAELPVEQPTKFELVINLTTAKALGLTIPTSVLLRADQSVE